tara:strand:- start:195 stop:719 length:525 start_codon:yes stop_codon:yes gene_type:complete
MSKKIPIDPDEHKKKKMMYHFSKLSKKYYDGHSDKVGDINFSNANRFRGKENPVIINNKFLIRRKKRKKRKNSREVKNDDKNYDFISIKQSTKNKVVSDKKDILKQQIKNEIVEEIKNDYQKVQNAKFKAVLVFLGFGLVTMLFIGGFEWGIGILLYLGVWVLYSLAYGWRYFL